MDYVQKYIDIGMFNADPEDHSDGNVLKNFVGRGSIFTVELSMQIDEQDVDQNFWKEHGITRVLAVDDEEVICENIRLTMEGTGVDVDYVLDGHSAKPVDMAVLEQTLRTVLERRPDHEVL